MCACGMAGEHMASPIIAFLAGAGTGYLKQRNIEEQRKRDAEDQQFRSEQREAWRKQQADADALNGNLKNAQAPAEVVEGALGDQSAGPPVPATLRQPPAAVSGSAGMTPPIAGQSPAALPQGGAAPPAVAPPAMEPPAEAPPVFRMVAPGGVNRTFNSSAEAQAAAKAYSSPEALNARFVAAYRGAGQLDKAQELENSFKRGQMADLQFSEAQKATIAKDADASLRAAVGGGAKSLSAFASESGLFGKGSVGFDTGKDGRVQFYSLGADGTKAMLGQPVENTQEALSGLVSPHWKSLDTSQYLNMLHRNAQAQRVHANDDRNYALNERRLNAGAGSRGSQPAMGMGAAGARAQGSPLQAANVQKHDAGTGEQWTPESGARQREKVFVGEAQNAKTAEEVQALKDRALKRGYTEEEMGRLDARFGTAPAPNPQAAAGSAAARQAKAEQEKQDSQIEQKRYEQRKAAERRQIGDSMAEAKRVFAARIQ